MYAVIRTGGKQYKVAPEDTLQIEKIEGQPGDTVAFPDVLMVGGEGEPAFGVPTVEGATVSAEVVEQGRGPKIIIFKKKRRQNYRRKNGHRQDLTTIRILEILTGGKKPALTAAAKPADEAAPAPKKAKAKASADAPLSADEAPKRSRKAAAEVKADAPASDDAPKKARAKAKTEEQPETENSAAAGEAKKPRAKKPKAEE